MLILYIKIPCGISQIWCYQIYLVIPMMRRSPDGTYPSGYAICTMPPLHSDIQSVERAKCRWQNQSWLCCLWDNSTALFCRLLGRVWTSFNQILRYVCGCVHGFCVLLMLWYQEGSNLCIVIMLCTCVCLYSLVFIIWLTYLVATAWFSILWWMGQCTWMAASGTVRVDMKHDYLQQ